LTEDRKTPEEEEENFLKEFIQEAEVAAEDHWKLFGQHEKHTSLFED
jgi:hypothetical protein